MVMFHVQLFLSSCFVLHVQAFNPYPVVINSEQEGEYSYSYTVRWEKPPIKEYLFKYRQVEVIKGTWKLEKPLEGWTELAVREDISKPLHIYNLEYLSPNSFYEVQVLARNELGTSVPNQQFIFGTADVSGAPGKPKAVKVKEETPTMVILSVLPPDSDGGTSIQGYRVEYEGLAQNFRIGEDIRLENLKPSTQYIFRVSARNEVRVGDSFLFPHTTESIRKPYPIVITSEPQGEYLFMYPVTWEKPLTGGLPIKEYQFMYRRVEVNEGTWTLKKPLEDWIKLVPVNKPRQWYVLQNLRPRSYYQLQVMVRNDIGISEPNQQFIFKMGDKLNFEP